MIFKLKKALRILFKEKMKRRFYLTRYLYLRSDFLRKADAYFKRLINGHNRNLHINFKNNKKSQNQLIELKTKGLTKFPSLCTQEWINCLIKYLASKPVYNSYDASFGKQNLVSVNRKKYHLAQYALSDLSQNK